MEINTFIIILTSTIGINITKSMQYLYIEHYEILLREFKGDLERYTMFIN